VSFDPTQLIVGLAGSAALIAAAWLQRIGNRGRNQQDPVGVSLTKVIDDRIADLKQRITDLEAETRQLRDERDTARSGREQLLHENEFLGVRNKELERFDDPNP
jgi:uncharacterized small protein (DUF1192 family)